MGTFTMFDTILQLPLFQGITLDQLTSILAKAKLDFTKYKKGDTLIESGTPCRQLLFILQGQVKVVTRSADDRFQLIEYLPSPYLIEPYSLFGMDTNYQRTYLAKTEVHTVSISKEFVVAELFNYEVFRINYLNILSHRSQQLHSRIWRSDATELRDHVKQFLLRYIEQPSGEKVLKVSLKDLADIMPTYRSSLSKILQEMQNDGLLVLRRSEITVPDASKLL